MKLKELNDKISEYRNIVIVGLVIVFGLLFIFQPYLNTVAACGGIGNGCPAILLRGNLN